MIIASADWDFRWCVAILAWNCRLQIEKEVFEAESPFGNPLSLVLLDNVSALLTDSPCAMVIWISEVLSNYFP